MSNDKQPNNPVIAGLVIGGQATVRNHNFMDIYCNHSRIAASPFDFSMTFSRIVEPTMGVNVIEDQVVIRMSPQHLKAFLDTASKSMSGWEECFGVVIQTTKLQSAEQVKEGFRKLKEAANK